MALFSFIYVIAGRARGLTNELSMILDDNNYYFDRDGVVVLNIVTPLKGYTCQVCTIIYGQMVMFI